ncbi:response regulator [Bacteroidota bacterium]
MKRILIVDDLPENIDVLGDILSNYNRSIAMNGEIALQIASSLLPDIILLDIMMPDMDGFEVCSRLKANEKTKNIPVIFITAKNSVEDETHGLELGAVDFISKPISPPTVLARVKAHLELGDKQKQLENLNLELSKRQKQLEKLNLNLEEKVAERTEMLEKANLRLSKLDEAKNQFIGLLSHELRTPLIGINGNAKFIITISSDLDVSECCEDILTSEKRLRKFAEISLLITSITSESYNLNLNKELISEFIDSSIYSSNELIEKKNIQVIKDISNEEVFVETDFSLLKTVFDSVMENAVKFSPNDSSIILKDGFENDKYIISVQDNGKGFSEKMIDNQFELFSTENLMSHSEGTGLSLVAAKAIMDAHNFDITLCNSENGGAMVVMIF